MREGNNARRGWLYRRSFMTYERIIEGPADNSLGETGGGGPGPAATGIWEFV